jgi:GNAT superfamily N-acetyltransferase
LFACGNNVSKETSIKKGISIMVKIVCEAVFEGTIDRCKVGIYINNKKVGSAELFKEKSKRFWVDWVYIQHKYRGMGNGVKMLKAIGKFADKRDWILTLEAYPDLVGFYKLAGFRAYKIDDRRAYMIRKPK